MAVAMALHLGGAGHSAAEEPVQAPSPGDLAKARAHCTALDGKVVAECVQHMLVALDYPDEYMRRAPHLER